MYPTMQFDVYKNFHPDAYHPEVTEVYSNYISRSNKYSNVKDSKAVAFVGLQYFIIDFLINEYNNGFFRLPKEIAVRNHKRIMSAMVGYPVSTARLEALHDLGYLPLEIKALPEGTMVPYQVTPLTVRSTMPGFQWLTNSLETVMSTENWPIQTACTTAVEYFKTFIEYARKTGMPEEFCAFQGHDFSFRGMAGRHAAAMTGFGHLASGLAGTDTVPAVLFAEKYYNADVDKELVGVSVNATEHSVTCSWQNEGEVAFYRHLMHNVAPTGILSLVFDTWDFWGGVVNILPELKDEIMERDGTIVIRPDSGDPVRILCGYGYDVYETRRDAERHMVMSDNNMHVIYLVCEDKFYKVVELDDPECVQWKPEFKYEELMECEVKGLIECLWDIFGGTISETGHKILDDHIGAIYGDSITVERQKEILSRLEAKGFASKVVLGIGSYTYQYVTRDTHGSAVKATSVIKNGVREAIFKDPKTDPGKKSAKGLLYVGLDDKNQLYMENDVSEEREKEGLLETVFLNGELVRKTTLAQIRGRIKEWVNSELE